MEKAEKILNDLTGRFPGLSGEIKSARRIFADVPSDIIGNVIDFVANGLGFSQLGAITGIDSVEFYEIIYHIANEDGIVLNLKLKVSKENPVFKTVLPVYQGAEYYEREIESMLGIKVEGLSEGRQYPLPDGWPEGQYPLRKDWTPDKLNAGGEK